MSAKRERARQEEESRTSFPMDDVEDIVAEANRVQRAYIEYLEAYREFLDVAEFCAQKGWPDFRPALKNAFRSNRLCLDRNVFRVRSIATHSPETLAAL